MNVSWGLGDVESWDEHFPYLHQLGAFDSGDGRFPRGARQKLFEENGHIEMWPKSNGAGRRLLANGNAIGEYVSAHACLRALYAICYNILANIKHMVR